MPVDATTSASSVINNYDGDLDELMNAIAAYTNRLPYPADAFTIIGLGTLTRGEDNIYTYSGANGTTPSGLVLENGGQYVWGPDGSGSNNWTKVSGLEVNGQPMNAATIEKPGFQLTAASVTNDITTNIGFISKSIADKNNWLSMIRNAVGR